MKSEFNILDDQSKYPDISKMHSKTVKMENLEYENVKPARLLSSISCLVYNQLQPLSSVPSFFCERSILSLQQQPLIPTSNVCPLPNPRTFSEISHYLSLVFRSSQQLYAPLFFSVAHFSFFLLFLLRLFSLSLTLSPKSPCYYSQSSIFSPETSSKSHLTSLSVFPLVFFPSPVFLTFLISDFPFF